LNLLFIIFQRVRHFFLANGANGIHSPFVFDFYFQVLNHPYNFYAFDQIEEQRDRLLDLDSVIEYQDLGSKSAFVKTKISQLAAKSLMPETKDVFLFQLCHWLKPKNVVELGTCLGITTAYLAKAYPARIYTFEGIGAISNEAKEVWKLLKINNIELIEGAIDATLPNFLIKNSPNIDIAIVDANHSYAATIANFKNLAPHISNNGCIVFDDIYWSSDMAKAWNEICEMPEVTISIDLFHLGLVFFRKESLKEKFIIHW